MHTPPHTPDKRAESSSRMKRAKPNSMRQVQVMPPHHVELTLPPAVLEDVHVAAHMAGGDLARSGRQSGGGEQAPVPTTKRGEH